MLINIDHKLFLFLQAESEATENVQLLLNRTREEMTKELWDRVSSTYDFPSDKETLLHFTNLQEWCKNCNKHEEKPEKPPISRDENKLESFALSRFQ